MELILSGDFRLLIRLDDRRSQSPEELLLELEDKLESGDLTLDEAAQLIRDHNRS